MIKKIILFTALIFAIGINTIIYSSETKQTSSANTLSDIIVALDTTRSKYHNKLLSPTTKILQKEYSIFIDYLSFQINDYCNELIKQYGNDSAKDLPCSLNKLESNKQQTSEEVIASLDEELMGTLGDFDEMLLVEDEKISQLSQQSNNQNKSDGQSGESSSSGFGSSSGTSSKSIISGNSKNKQSNNQQKYNSITSGNRNSRQKNKSLQRRNLDEIDDDIVARQLKEAAEKEQNLDLQEKLWDEYYKYKKSIINNNAI